MALSQLQRRLRSSQPGRFTEPVRRLRRSIETFYLLGQNYKIAYEDAYDLFVPHGRASHKRAFDVRVSHMRYLTGVYLLGVYLTGVYLIDVHLMGVYLTGVHLMDIHLIGVYLTGVHGVYAS